MCTRLRRRLFVAAGIGLLVRPLSLVAQERPRPWRIGFLASRQRPTSLETDVYGAISANLKQMGYLEGRDFVIEWRFAEHHYERFPALLADLLRLKVDVIVTDGTPPTLAAQRATRTVPIITANAGDAVGSGLVQSLRRPGGNITGVSLMLRETHAKQLEMLLVMAPGIRRVAFLINPRNEFYLNQPNAEAVATSAGVMLTRADVSAPNELEPVFARMASEGVAAFLLAREQVFQAHLGRIAELAAKYRLPACGNTGFPEVGGLMSYATNPYLNWRRTMEIVVKVLKGANPAETPMEQPTELELVINRQTARALGLEVPAELAVLATRIIE
jgi:putative ABC transport system substrate-binding protein